MNHACKQTAFSAAHTFSDLTGVLCHFFYSSKSLLKEFARNDAPFENADIDTGYVVTRKGFKKRVDKLDLSFMNYQDAFKSKSTMEVSENI